MTIPEFPSRRDLEAHQLAQLQTLVRAIVPANPFHTRKLRAAGNPRFDTLEEFTSRVPFTLKRELTEDQLENPPYGSNLTYPIETYNRFCQTSGTSGRPLRWIDTPETWEWMVANWKHVFDTAGVTARDRIFFASAFGPFLGFWLAFDAAERAGCLCIPGGGMRSAMRLQIIFDNAVTVLCCTPTYALRLAEAAQQENIDLSTTSVRMMIAAGEPGASVPGTRTQIEKLWNGARVVDHHGMTETGPVSYGCPAQPDILHVIESSYFAEVLEPGAAQPVAPGPGGELILTPLGRPGSPVLRYRTGDLVRPAARERCACGTWDLALHGGIIGRVDDMLVVRGVNLYPSAVDGVLRSIGNIAEYRVEVRRLNTRVDLLLHVEPSPGFQNDATLAQRIHQALLNTIGVRIEVSIVPPETLPRFEMKASRWVRY